ncbi:transcriptional regulator [Acetobacteraceae bacterium]|nr:transcriptional regulator [Acetobacteraceae bacterium]
MCEFLVHNERMKMTTGDKLRALRERTGLSLRETARRLGLGNRWSTYRANETNQKREFLPVPLVQQLEKIFVGLGKPPVTFDEVWELALPDSQIDEAIDRSAQEDPKNAPHSGLIKIPEYDISASAGGGMIPISDVENASKIWFVPPSFLAGVNVEASNKLAIMLVAGDSMEPDYSPGERILIDLSYNRLTHDGVYVFGSDQGNFLKQLQIIPKSKGAMVRIISRNSTYPMYEMDFSEIRIIGRVAGKWVWK